MNRNQNRRQQSGIQFSGIFTAGVFASTGSAMRGLLRGFCVGIVCVIAWMGFVACNDKKEKQAGRSETISEKSLEDESEKPDRDEEESGDVEKDDGNEVKDDQGEDEPGDAFDDPDSPTGISLCDEYLKVVCECAKKHSALKIACENGKSSAPRWKESSVKEPSSRKIVEESCRKALAQVKENFGCE